jgi:hypothetical protein
MRRLIFLFIIFLFTAVSPFIFLSFYAKPGDSKIKQNCDCIWGIKSITVEGSAVIVEFQQTYHMAYFRQKNGKTIEINKVIPFVLNIGEALELIGDHEGESITLKTINAKFAYLVVTDEHHPPPGIGSVQKHTLKCEIFEKWEK